MKGFKSLYSTLAKTLGTKMATGITVTAITVTSTAGICVVGYSGHLIGNYIEEHQEETESLLTYDSEIAEETKPGRVQEEEIPVQSLEENLTEETEKEESQTKQQGEEGASHNHEEVNRNHVAVTNQKPVEEISPQVADTVTTPVVTTPVLPVTQQISDTLTTIQQQDTNIVNAKKSSSGKHSSKSDSKDDGLGSENSGDNPEPIAPSEEVQFLNHKVSGYIEPMTLTIDTEAYRKLYGDSDKNDKMFTKTYTVMVYMCGTDLETGSSEEGTHDIMKMLSQKYDMTNTNVLLCAGGTSTWKNTYMGNDGDDGCNNDDVRCNIYYLNPDSEKLDDIENRDKLGQEKADEDTKNQVLNEDTLRLLVSLDPTDMGEDELLAGFINLATEYFPADNYGAILWNHGGGLNSGVCFSDSNEEKKVTGSAITAEELECALASSTLGKNNEKFGFIGFDACMMGSTELAYNISPYCEYMIGCMEYTSGGWNYGDIFQYISGQEERDTLNKDIALKIANEYYDNHLDNYDNVASIACYDLSTIQTTVDQINKVSDSILELYNEEIYPKHPELASECYRILKQAKLHSYENGTDKERSTFQYVDQNSFFTYLKNAFRELELSYLEQEVKEWETDTEKAAETEILTEHLNNLQTDIEEILKNDTLLFAGAHYYGQEVFQKAENAGITYSAFWNELKGEAIAGTNIYMPYDWLAGSEMGTYQEMNLMDGYARLLKQYMEQAGSSEEKERIEELSKEVNYANIFEAPVLKETSEGNVPYLQVKVKEDYEEGKKPEHGEDPYTDFMDTLSSMKVYISNYQELSKDKYVDMVIADADINFSSLTGENKEVNVVLSTLKDVVGYLATGKLWEDTKTVLQDAKTVYDWGRLSYLENEDKSDEKNGRINELFGSADNEIDATEWKTFKGMSYLESEEGTLGSGEEAILYFQKIVNDDSDDYYVYKGASIEYNNTYSKAENQAISFYHYYINDDGEEQRFDEIDVKLDTTSEEICLYEKYLCKEDFSQYNNYTIGVESLQIETYVIPPVATAQSEEYSDNPYLVGAEVTTDAQTKSGSDEGDTNGNATSKNKEDDVGEIDTSKGASETKDETDSELFTEEETTSVSEAPIEAESMEESELSTETEEESDEKATMETETTENELSEAMEETDESVDSSKTEEETDSESTIETGMIEENDFSIEETENESSSDSETANNEAASETSETDEGQSSESDSASSDNASSEENTSEENSSKKEEDDTSHSDDSSGKTSESKSIEATTDDRRESDIEEADE